jgi:hypothetical protein
MEGAYAFMIMPTVMSMILNISLMADATLSLQHFAM